MKKEIREMGRRRGRERERERERETSKSYTLPSSPSGSSSSDFEFTISISPRKTLCPADELFYKGQLLPLHLSERISMVRTLLLSSSSSSSSSTSPRDSTSNDSHSSFDSSRPSSATDDDDLKRLHPPASAKKPNNSKYFSFSRFSSVFRKETNTNTNANTNSSSVKRISVTAREVIRKYLKKVKPLYDKLSQKQNKAGEELTLTPECDGVGVTASANTTSSERSTFKQTRGVGALSHSFSGNLRYPRRRSCVSSCPSSMRSSPNHSGVLSHQKLYCGDTSSMEELQSAIQGAIAHCKNSLTQNKTMVSNEI